MSAESRPISEAERRALEIIGAAVPCYAGETIADQATRLVTAYQHLARGMNVVLSEARTTADATFKSLRPTPTAIQRDAVAVAALGGTRGT